jgi:hypothetical protein
MNNEYQILRWDAILTNNSITKIPIIYVEPDIALLEYLKANDFMIMVKIQGTGTIYDNKLIAGIVNKSCDVPNCRKNFWEQTGSYIVQLMCVWNGYPPCNRLGKVSFMGLDQFIVDLPVCNVPYSNCDYVNNDSFNCPECINCEFGVMRY